MAAKIGIEEYFMEKILKFHKKFDQTILRWKVRPKKSKPNKWTYMTCWNSGVQLSCLKWVAAKIFPHSPLHRSGLYIYIASALWNVRRILRTAPLGLRYHRALCLGRRDDRIRRISQASNIKKPTRFMGTSWIVGSDEGHDSAIRSVCLFRYRTSISATLCQDAK